MRFTHRRHDGRDPAAALRVAARRTLAALFTAISAVAAGIAVASVATFGAAEVGSVHAALGALAVAIFSGVQAHRARVET